MEIMEPIWHSEFDDLPIVGILTGQRPEPSQHVGTHVGEDETFGV